VRIFTALQRATLQHTATYCNTLQRIATHYNTRVYPIVGRGQTGMTLSADLHHTATQYTATHCNAIHCNTLQHTATHCNTLQHIATRRNTLQRMCLFNSLEGAQRDVQGCDSSPRCNTPHCNTLQHTATHCNTHMCIPWSGGGTKGCPRV